MTDPRFRPKDLTPTPSRFGKYERIDWFEASDAESAARLNAAQWQHAYSMSIRYGVASHFGDNLQRYAREAGCTYDRLTKVLRGDVLMRSEDVGRALSLLPDLHTDALADLTRMSPAVRRISKGTAAVKARTS